MKLDSGKDAGFPRVGEGPADYYGLKCGALAHTQCFFALFMKSGVTTNINQTVYVLMSYSFKIISSIKAIRLCCWWGGSFKLKLRYRSKLDQRFSDLDLPFVIKLYYCPQYPILLGLHICFR